MDLRVWIRKRLAALDEERQALEELLQYAPKRSYTRFSEYRDWVVTRKGNPFTADEFAAAFGKKTAGIRVQLERMMRMGMIRNINAGRPVKARYRYVEPPNNAPASRPRTKEEAPKVRNGHGNGRGKAAPGTGKGGKRVSDKDVRDLLAAVAKAGAIAVKDKNHYKVVKDGRLVATVPATPSDYRTLKNCKADLRRNGVPV
jgi:predicted transcriptional regulator